MNDYTFLLIFTSSALINLGLAIYGWMHRHLPGAKAFSLAALLFMVWPLAQAIDILTSDLAMKIILMKSRLDAPIFGGIVWLVMVTQLTEQTHLLNKRRLAIICSIPILTMILNLTSYSYIFRYGYYLDYGGIFPILRWSNGPWFWVWFLWSYTIFILPFYVLGRSYRNLSHLTSQQGLTVLAALALPLVVNLLFQFKITPIVGLNLTSATFPISGILIIGAAYRYHLFNAIPIARGLIIENMSDGVLVLDIQNRVVDVNPVMLQMLGQTSTTMIGRNAEAFFSTWPEVVDRFRKVDNFRSEISLGNHYLDLRISPLHNHFNKPMGRLIVVHDITTQKQAEKALEASEKNFRHILESTPDAMFIVNQAGKIIFANVQSEAMFGYDRAELQGKPIEGLIPVRFAEIHKKHQDAYFVDPKPRQMGVGMDMKLAGRRKDGTEFPVEISLSPFDTNEETSVIAAIRDVTERQQTENKLRLQAAALDAAANAIMITDAQAVIQWINPAFTRLTGYSESEIIGKKPKILRSGEHDPSFYKTMEQIPLEGHVWKGEIINRHKDGHQYIEEQTITPVFDENSEISHFISIKQDITERKQAEEASRMAEYKYRTLVEQMPAVLYIDGLDKVGIDTYAYVSPQIVTLLGYPKELWDKDPNFWQQCVHHEDYERAVAVTQNTLKKERVVEEYRMIAQDGRVIWVRDHSILVRDIDNKPQFVQGFWEDITEQKQAEDKLLEKETQMRALNDNLPSGYTYQLDFGIHGEMRQFIFISAGIEKIFGLSPQEIMHDQTRLRKRFLEEDNSKIMEIETSAFSAMTTFKAEARFIRKNNQIGWLLLTSTPRKAANDHIIWDGIALDITEHKRAEFELQTALARTKVLYDVANTAITSEGLTVLLQNIIQHVAQDLPANRASLIIFDHKTKKINQIARGGTGADQISPSVTFDEIMEGLSGWAIRTGQTALSFKDKPDSRESEAVQKRRKETNCGSILVTPLHYQNTILGTMTLINLPEEPDFTNKDVELVEAIASQISSVIIKITLEESLYRQNSHLTALHEITLGLINHHEPNLVLKAILTHITELINARHAYVDILETGEEDAMVNKVAVGNFSLQPGFKVRRGMGITGHAWERDDIVVIPDYSQWEGGYSEFRWIRSAIAIPMKVKGQVIGVIGVAFDEPNHNFTSDEVALLQRFTDLASITLDNAQLISNALRQAQELKLLHEVRTAIAREIGLTHIVKQTVEAITNTFGYTLVSLYLLDGDTLILQHQVGYNQVIQEIPISMGISGRVIRTGKPVLLEDVRNDPEFLGAVEGIVSEAIVPIFEKDQAIGILSVESKDGVKLTEADLLLMSALSDQISIAFDRARLYGNIQRQNEQLATLHQITFDLLNKHDIANLLQAIVEQAARFLGAPYSEIMLIEKDELVVKAFTENQPQLVGDHIRRDEAFLSWKAFDTQLPAMVDDYSTWQKHREIYNGMDLGAVVAVPILLESKSIGVLDISRAKDDKPFGDDEIQAAMLFSQLAALALDNAQLHEALRQESIRDPLTGLFNRRFMEEILPKELKRAERGNYPLAVVMFDLDHFKNINDSFGHDAGDKVLHQLSLLLKANIRGGDIACRYGGEEFIFILPNAPLSNVLQRMEQLRMDLKQLKIQHMGKLIAHLSGSFGIANYPQHASTSEELVKAADDALYRAKQAGRDRIITA